MAWDEVMACAAALRIQLSSLSPAKWRPGMGFRILTVAVLGTFNEVHHLSEGIGGRHP